LYLALDVTYVIVILACLFHAYSVTYVNNLINKRN
jgi:hypothetical protein